MNPHIFNKENPHNWRTKLFIFFIVAISAGIAYLAQAHFGSTEAIVKENKINNQELENISREPTVAGQESEINDQQIKTGDQENKDEKKIDILSPPVIERDKNPITRLDEAKIYTQPQISNGKYIDISLEHQNLVIFEDGKALDAFLISSGRKGFNTPMGTFKIENKSPRAWSKTYSLWMPDWMAFLPTGQMGIHELPEWPGGYKEPATHLGTPVSHGCIRLGVGPAKQVYDWAEIGTPVVIHK